MSSFGPKNLQTKFLLGLGAIILLLGTFFAAGLYMHLSALLDSQVKDRADVVLGQVGAVQAYVREVLRPKMYETLPADEFVIEAMSSSYISRTVMQRFNSGNADYHYRRVAENARNRQFEANAEERELIRYFRTHEGERFWEGYRKIKGREYFVKARPVVFKKSCLTCHGVPGDAPRVLLERYGAERGFGHVAGTIGGLVVVGIPVQRAMARIREATIGYAVLYGGGMLIFFAMVQVFFNRLIVQNLHRLTRRFRDLFREEAELGVMQRAESGDEIEEVVRGLEELGDHLHEMHHQLRQHSDNLEQMVEVRTSELRHEADERRADVRLFVRLLDGLNKTSSRRGMWEYALPLIVMRFRAREGAFVCMFASQNYYTWPEGAPKPELPDTWKDILTEGRPHYEPGRAFIPVGASDLSAEGILCLKWDKGARIKTQDRDVLRALGHQMGIAIENLTAMHNLLRQKDMLQAVVEGIGDPLLLVDGGCGVVLANEAARGLAASLGGDGSTASCAGLFKADGLFQGCPLHAAMESGSSHSREVRAEDGRHFVLNVFPVAHAEAEAEGGRGVVYIRDVTQEKHMLDSMQQSEKLATVGQLAAGLAHEMNNPLGVIKCYAELLKGARAGDEVTGDARVILKHATQAQSVLQDLLNFARPKQAEPTRVDVGKAVEAVIGVFRMRAEKGGVTVERRIEEPLPDIVANEQAVEQILTNLLNNALDAVAPDEGRITVEVARDGRGGGVAIRIADNGHGVSGENAKKLFDPFFTTKEIGKGTGLGLAVVYGLVQEMGGSIDVHNDGGAVFTVRLPVRNPGVSEQP